MIERVWQKGSVVTVVRILYVLIYGTAPHAIAQ